MIQRQCLFVTFLGHKCGAEWLHVAKEMTDMMDCGKDSNKIKILELQLCELSVRSMTCGNRQHEDFAEINMMIPLFHTV